MKSNENEKLMELLILVIWQSLSMGFMNYFTIKKLEFWGGDGEMACSGFIGYSQQLHSIRNMH